MVSNNLADHALRLGECMLSLLKQVEKESSIIGEARGKGLMLGAEFAKDKETKEPAPELARTVRAVCQRGACRSRLAGTTTTSDASCRLLS
jgi:diaminobutyrate-2-oxoglutarate transaminase